MAIDYCIPRDVWLAADDTETERLTREAREAYWEAFEVVHQNSDWTAFEKEGALFGMTSIGEIQKPARWGGSEFDPHGGNSRASKWGVGDLHGGAAAYRAAPNTVGSNPVRQSSKSKKFPICPNTAMDAATEGYKAFVKQMVALGASEADKIGLNNGIDAGDIAAAAKSKEGRDALMAKSDAITAEKEAKEEAIAQQVVGEYKDVEFREQCFLLAKIFDIITYKNLNIEPVTIKPLPYADGNSCNACLMAQTDPYGFMNKLTQYPTQQSLLEMKTQDIAMLQPQIRLFKMSKNSRGKEYAQEFNFDSHATQSDLASMLTTAGKRGFGVGIKEFTFAYEGNNPFAVKKSISAKLTIFANTFDELLKDRGGYMYADLALKTGGAKARAALDKLNTQAADVKIENLAKLDFRLKAVVGWANPPNPLFTDGAISDAINNSFVTLNLTPTVHEFGFDDQGRVTFTCNYLAYVEDFFDQPIFNVFSDKEVEKNVYKRRLQYQAYNEVCDSKMMAEYKKQIAAEVKADRNKALISIYTLLSKYNKLQYINVPWAQLLNFKEQGPYWNLEEGTGFEIGQLPDSKKAGIAAGLIADQDRPKEEKEDDGFWASVKNFFTGGESGGGDDRTEKQKLISTITKDAQTEQIVFFFLADLIDVILKGIDDKIMSYDSIIAQAKQEVKDVTPEQINIEKDKIKRLHENYKKLRVLLGPVEIVNPQDTSKSIHVNFGDVPISLRYFLDWLGEKTLKKDEISYPLPKFLNDLMNSLVRDFLNNDTCFGYSIKQKTRVNQASVAAFCDNGYDGQDLDPITSKIGKHRNQVGKKTLSRLYVDALSRSEFPILNISGIRDDPRPSKGQSDEYNYLIYYAARTQPVERMNGNYHEDVSQGILHYMIGKDRGIIKKINLQKTDSPGLKEVRFEQEGFEGLNQLREVYDITIDTYANVSAFPGVYIFVDPRGFVPNMSYEVKEEGFNVEDLSDYGLGGYYMVIRSEHTFGPGKANTKITAKWVNEIHKELDRRDKKAVKAGKKPKDTPQKCGILIQERKQAKGSWLSNLMGSELSPESAKDTGSLPDPAAE